MITNSNLWIIAFVTAFSFFCASLVFGWVAFRYFFYNRNYKSLSFGLGLLVLAAGNLTLVLLNPEQIIISFVAIFTIGFILVFLGVVKKKWHYIFSAFSIAPFLVVQNTAFIPVLIPILIPFFYLVYKNTCRIFCAEEACRGKKGDKQNIEWLLVFVFLSVSLTFYMLLPASRFTNTEIMYALGGVTFNLLAAATLYYHVLICTNFSKIERIFIPVVLFLLTVLAVISFFSNMLINNYVENLLKNDLREEILAAKTIAEQYYPEGELAKSIKESNPKLNETADVIFAKTGIRVGFFKDNERIAAAPSATGKGRLLGSRIENRELIETVLNQGNIYEGIVIKGGEPMLAAYTPLLDGNKVVGMIGTGKKIDTLTELHDKLIYRTLAGVAISILGIYGAIIYWLPKRSKTL